MGIKQTTAQYRLNYLWNTKIEIAKAINEVGKNKGIHVNPRETFISFAEKILKLETSVWSSALDSPDPHLTITENGYYKVSDLSLTQFGDASAKTVVSSFYVNVQSAPIIIGNPRLECGGISNVGTNPPDYDFNETFTGDIPTILSQLANRLGIVMGAQAIKDGTNWNVTFDNNKVIIFSESGSITSQSGLSLGTISGSPVTFKIIKNTKAIFLTMSDGLSYTAGKSFILATTDNGDDAAWVNLGYDECGYSSHSNLSVIIGGTVITPDVNDFSYYRTDYDTIYGSHITNYMMYNTTMVIQNNTGVCIVDFGENLFIGPRPGRGGGTTIPISFHLGNSDFSALLNSSCFWQRTST